MNRKWNDLITKKFTKKGKNTFDIDIGTKKTSTWLANHLWIAHIKVDPIKT